MASTHRTYWIVRQRYRRAGYVGSLAALVAAALYLVPNVHGADADLMAAAYGVWDTAGMLSAAAVLPPILARVCWRIHRRRYLDDIYTLGVL
jgi:hypothetical protein